MTKEEIKNWVFHFYKLIWWWLDNYHKFDDKEIQKIIIQLNKQWPFPNDQDPQRYVFHEIKKLNNMSWFFWFFVRYYEEKSITIENQNWSIHQTSERYSFIYLSDSNTILFQHKMWYDDKPSISIVKEEFQKYFLWNIMQTDIRNKPARIEEFFIGNEPIEFVKFFFNKENIIKKIVVENLTKEKFMETKESGAYSYFNPSPNESDPVLQTEEFEIEHLKKMEAEAEDGKTLGKIPAVRIAMAATNDFKYLSWFTKTNEEIVLSEKINSIDSDINNDNKVTEEQIYNIIRKFLLMKQYNKTWKKIKTKNIDQSLFNIDELLWQQL